MAVVELEKVCKSYKGTADPAVDGVSLTVEDGEFMVLLGPSGCGKSTTLRMIAGLETISAGNLLIDGRLVNDVPAKDRDIAMVFQSYALYPHMTVSENLAFGLRRRGIRRGEVRRRVTEVAATLRLSELLDRKPFALSGGQRQRVALGRAIVREPKVFLFDEPLSNLDAALRVNTRNQLVRLHHRLRATMIYVTHDQIEAMTMGQRICVMNKGRVVQIGRPLDVYRQPADAFVARFLGSPPMNLINAPLTPTAGGFAADIAGCRIPLPRWRTATLARCGGTVLLGVRPEDLILGEDGNRRSSLAGTVAAVEPLGAETLLVVDLGGGLGEITARLSRDVIAAIGDRVIFGVRAEAIYLFDLQTENALPPEVIPPKYDID